MQHKQPEPKKYSLNSPEGRLQLDIEVAPEGAVSYQLLAGDDVVIERSQLALYGDAETPLALLPPDHTATESARDVTWEQPWGEQRFVRDYHRELALGSPEMTIRFRLFDDGLGLRYELAGTSEQVIQRETTEFALDPDAHAWWIPALGKNHYEHLYTRSPLADIGVAHTPLTIELPSGRHLAIHEAALYDYGSMNLAPSSHGLTSTITPLAEGIAARVSLPWNSPWRTVIVADSAVGLTTSRIMINLNEPSRIADTSWIAPAKFLGIWWGMFIGYYTWGSGPTHGATTTNTLRYINAAKRLGLRGLLIEGWNEGWDGDWTQNGDKMNHLQPYPDFDIHAITTHAATQGIDIIGHHETSGNIAHYNYELPEAYDYYRTLGVRYVKTGYVNGRLNDREFHSSQVGVRHYQQTVEMAAERQMMLDIHEPVKGTGIERTWPNLLTREGVMGQEYEGGAVRPEHTAILPYTRLLAGPLDYTPGLFNLSGTDRKVQTTLAKQLAFYVTMYSPLQMAADLPEHYEAHLDAFGFIRDVPVTWETTVPLQGAIGDYYTVARKDRHSDDWYIGGVSDEYPRSVSLSLDFLDEHRPYLATIYRDAADAHYQARPEAYEIIEQRLARGDTLELTMAAGGGFAVRLVPQDDTPYPYPS